MQSLRTRKAQCCVIFPDNVTVWPIVFCDITHQGRSAITLSMCYCALWCFVNSRRSVSEVQLMHSVSVHKHVQQRQDWLQEHMQDIHTAPLHDGKITGKRVPPEDLPYKAVTPDTPKVDVGETLETQWTMDASLCLRRALCINDPHLISIPLMLNTLLFILFLFIYLSIYIDLWISRIFPKYSCLLYICYIHVVFILELLF